MLRLPFLKTFPRLFGNAFLFGCAGAPCCVAFPLVVTAGGYSSGGAWASSLVVTAGGYSGGAAWPFLWL